MLRREKSDYSDRLLVAALTEASIVIDKAGLEELRLLVNCLKHNSEGARKLYKIRRDLFESDFDPDATHPATGRPLANIDWAEKVVLTNNNVETYSRSFKIPDPNSR